MCKLGKHKLRFDFFYCSSGSLDFDDFLLLMADKSRETDIEIHYKDTFRAFSKDDDGDCAFGKLKEISKYLFPRLYSSGRAEVCYESLAR